MSLTVVTGCWGERRAEYARPFGESFARFWPESVELVVYADGEIPVPSRAKVRRLDDCGGYTAFRARHSGHAEKAGRKPTPGARWKDKDLARGYNFRFDALRFAGQGFIPDDAARMMLDGDVLCWLDADVVTHGPVSEGFVEDLIGNADGAYLGRAPKHSEIGFWAVRLNEHTRAMVAAFAGSYRSDRVFGLKEWHSAYVWDAARLWFEGHGLVEMRNLTPGGQGHVWLKSPLRERLEHRKGARKGFVT